MKCNTLLPGKVYQYYTTVNMQVRHADTTNKTDLENANLF